MRTVEVAGRVAAYDEAGDGPGPPLVLVHGFTGDREDFADVVAPLAVDRRVLAVDLPGHGESEPHAGPADPAAYELAALSRWLLAFVMRCAAGPVYLAGHSLGGLLVQRAAASASQRVTGLVLASTGPGALPDEAGERVTRIAAAVRDGGPTAAVEMAVDHGASAAERERTARRLAHLPPAAVVGTARALVTAEPLGAFLRGIDVPVLVIHGADDDAWPVSAARQLAATVPGAQLAVLDGAGHSAMREEPGEWATAVAGFLRAADKGGARRPPRRRG